MGAEAKHTDLLKPRLTMRGVCKRFGPTVALDGVDLTVAPGEIHALIGENGAGKSTLMKVLSGAICADAGSMTLDGRSFLPDGPQSARLAGVSIVYQELNLAPHLTVEQNMVLGVEARSGGWIRRSVHRDRVQSALQQLNRADIRPNALVQSLPPASRQLVEIARALLSESRVVIFDEPTSSLGLSDIEHLFTIIRSLRNKGVAVIYISHFLEEIRRIADRFTVLRDGRTVGSGIVEVTSDADLVTMMIGRKLEEMFPRIPHGIGAPILELSNLTGRPLPRSATCALHRGEILGIAGLVGAGRTEMLRCLFGLAPVAGGAVRIGGVAFEKPAPPASLRRGMGLLSEDRRHEGLAADRTVAENITLSRLEPCSRGGWVNLRRMNRAAAGWIDRLGIRTRGPRQPASELSGGNQQKIALARLLHHDVDVLLLDEPTRGIDVASKADIYRQIGELAAAGKAILMVSSYTPELLGICDRVAVMHRGRLGPARPAADWTEHAIVHAATTGEAA